MKIAITGATGFIGRNVLSELESHEVELVAIARSDRKDLTFLTNGNWVTLDIENPPKNAYEVIGKPEILIHLAWKGLSNYRSLHHFEKELPSHYTFLKKLISQGLKTLLVTGTCLEYGMQYGELSSSLDTHPECPYSFAKDTLRKQLEYLQTGYQFNLVWSRLFYIYGKGQPKTSLIPQLESAVQQKKKQFNMSGGEQLRDYLPVSKVARYLVTLAMKKKNLGIVNVCSGKPKSVRSIIESLIKKNKWKIKLNLGYYPYPDYEPFAFWGDRRKLDALLKENENGIH